MLDPGDPQGNVAALLHLLRPYLMHRGELLDFYHAQLEEAAAKRYLAEDTNSIKAHKSIADYFDTRWRDPNRHALSELPYHQTHGHLSDDLVETLQNVEFLQTKCRAGMTFELIDDLALASAQGTHMPEAAELLCHLHGALLLRADAIADSPDCVGQELVLGLRVGCGSGGLIENFVKRVTYCMETAARPWLYALNAPVSSTVTEGTVAVPSGAKLAFSEGRRSVLVLDANGVVLIALHPHTLQSVSVFPADRRLPAKPPSPPVVSHRLEPTGSEWWEEEWYSFSMCSHRVSIGHNGRVRISSLTTGAVVADTRENCTHLALSNDARMLAVAGTVVSPSQQYRHDSRAYLFSDEGRFLELCGPYRREHFERLTARHPPFRRKLDVFDRFVAQHPVEDVFEITPGGKAFCGLAEGRTWCVTAIDLSDDRRCICIGFDSGCVMVATLPPSLVEGTEDWSSEFAACEIRMASGEVQSCLTSHGNERLYVLSSDGTVRILRLGGQGDAAAMTNVEVGQSPDQRWLAFKPEGARTFLSLSGENKTRVIEGAPNQIEEPAELIYKRRRGVAFTPDSALALCVGDGQMPCLYDIVADTTAPPEATWSKPCHAVFSSDGRWVALCYTRMRHQFGHDPTLRLLDLASGRVVRDWFFGRLYAAFAPEGNALVVNAIEEGHGAELVDLETGGRLAEYRIEGMKHFTNHAGPVAVSPNGRFTVVGSSGVCLAEDQRRSWNVENIEPGIHVFNTRSGQLLATTPLGNGAPLGLCFFTCGDYLAMALSNRFLQIRRIPNCELVTQIRLTDDPVNLFYSRSLHGLLVGAGHGWFIFQVGGMTVRAPWTTPVRYFHLHGDAKGGVWDPHVVVRCPSCGKLSEYWALVDGDLVDLTEGLCCPLCREALRLTPFLVDGSSSGEITDSEMQ